VLRTTSCTPQPVELLGQPVDARLAAQAGAGGVEIDHQRFAGRRIAAVRPAGFGQQPLRLVDRLALRLPVHPVIHAGVHAGAAVAVAEDAGRQRRLARQAPTVLEDGNELFLIERDADGLAQLARALAQAADHRVEQVEAHVHGGGRHRCLQPDALRLHVVAQADFAGLPNCTAWSKESELMPEAS
jgi:hypothetical protein